jgi:DNA-binding NarL/FixJ family response regulator
MSEVIKIAVIDDHGLFRKGLIKLIKSLDTSFEIILEASNGEDFLNRLSPDNLPDIAIVDIDMPIMDGFETSATIEEAYPSIHVLIITMMEDEKSLIRMIKSGVKGFLSKDVEPDELKKAIHSIALGKFHYNDAVSGKLIQMIQSGDDPGHHGLNHREYTFLEFCCSELTYKEIADQMFLSPKTIDGYRANLFERFNAKSRVGLVLLAIKNEWVKIK